MNERNEHHYTTEEIGRRGREIYERSIRREVESRHRGKFIIIDITTGEYEIGESGREASDKMRERKPGAIMHGTRVGEKTAHRLGHSEPETIG